MQLLFEVLDEHIRYIIDKTKNRIDSLSKHMGRLCHFEYDKETAGEIVAEYDKLNRINKLYREIKIKVIELLDLCD